MAEKCSLCNKKIEEGFLGKLEGTIVKIKKGDSNEIHHVCPECQKKHKGKLKEELSKQ
jgi:hypothetical protein